SSTPTQTQARGSAMSTIDLNTIFERIGPDFAAQAEARDTDEQFGHDNYDALKEHRVMSAMVPVELGGGGASHREMAAFVRRLAGSCGATALALSMHQHLVGAAVFNWRHGRPGWKVLEKVAKTEAVLVSTGANDWLESSGSVRRTDGGFL